MKYTYQKILVKNSNKVFLHLIIVNHCFKLQENTLNSVFLWHSLHGWVFKVTSLVTVTVSKRMMAVAMWQYQLWEIDNSHKLLSLFNILRISVWLFQFSYSRGSYWTLNFIQLEVFQNFCLIFEVSHRLSITLICSKMILKICHLSFELNSSPSHNILPNINNRILVRLRKWNTMWSIS